MLARVILKFKMLLRRANIINAEMQEHINDEQWYNNNKDNLKLELKSLRTDIMWLINFIDKGE